MTNYKILGVSQSATKDEIKSAYRKLAKKYHPDINKKADPKKFIEITQAYEAMIKGDAGTSDDYQDPFSGSAKDWYRDRQSKHQAYEQARRQGGFYQDPFYRTDPFGAGGSDWGFGQEQPKEDPPISTRQVRELLRYDIDKRPAVFSQYGYTCDGCHKAYKGGNMLYYFAMDKKLCRKCKKDILDWMDNNNNFN